MLESKAGVLFIAGLGFFALAFLSNAMVPALMYRDLPEQTVEQLLRNNGNLRFQFEDLARRFPESFTAAYGRPPEAAAEREKWLDTKSQEALQLGHDVYVAEACWHCHSQFVRPVSNEDRRFGPVSKTEEYQNVLQRPVLFGTRRVGPDLCREGGTGCRGLPDRTVDQRRSGHPADQHTRCDRVAVARLIAVRPRTGRGASSPRAASRPEPLQPPDGRLRKSG